MGVGMQSGGERRMSHIGGAGRSMSEHGEEGQRMSQLGGLERRMSRTTELAFEQRMSATMSALMEEKSAADSAAFMVRQELLWEDGSWLVQRRTWQVEHEVLLRRKLQSRCCFVWGLGWVGGGWFGGSVPFGSWVARLVSWLGGFSALSALSRAGTVTVVSCARAMIHAGFRPSVECVSGMRCDASASIQS